MKMRFFRGLSAVAILVPFLKVNCYHILRDPRSVVAFVSWALKPPQNEMNSVLRSSPVLGRFGGFGFATRKRVGGRGRGGFDRAGELRTAQSGRVGRVGARSQTRSPAQARQPPQPR